MKNNQRGGILSKLLFIPTVVLITASVFFLGYYLGRHYGKPDAPGGDLPPLPEVVSGNLPKPEEFTFFRTLTAKEDKTVSIELRPRPQPAEGAAASKQATDQPKQPVAQEPKKREAAGRSAEKTEAPNPPVPKVVEKTPEPRKRETTPKQATSSAPRYTVQISSHQERQTADLAVKKMKHEGFAAFIVSSKLPGRGTWYRVRVGSFASREAAEKLQKQVRAKAGVASIVVAE